MATTAAPRSRVFDPRTVAEAVDEVVPRVATLVASIDRPDAPAVGVWSAIETSVHLMQTMEADLRALDHDAEPVPDDLGKRLRETTLADLGEFTRDLVRAEPEREPPVLAARMTEAASRLAAILRASEADGPVGWLGGMRLPTSAVGAHVVEESLVHGHDIARSQRRPWKLDRDLAMVAVGGFVMPVIRAVDPADMVNTEQARGLRACFEVRVRGVGTLWFRFDDAALSVFESWDGPVDVRLSADPRAFLLVQLERSTPAVQALLGRMVVWGRRPWLMARFGDLVAGP